MIQNFKKYKTSDRIYILGSGRSVLDITKEEWKEMRRQREGIPFSNNSKCPTWSGLK